MTNIPGLYAIGECDYQYHGANRLGANSLLSCIFSGLIVAPGVQTWIKFEPKAEGRRISRVFVRSEKKKHQAAHDKLLKRHRRRREPVPDPSRTRQRDDQGRHGRPPQQRASRRLDARCKSELQERADEALLALGHRQLDEPKRRLHQGAASTCFRSPSTILKGAIAARRMPRRSLQAGVRDAGHRRERHRPIRTSKLGRAEWVDRVRREHRTSGSRARSPSLGPTASRSSTYEDVDTTLITPRPRLYGLVGAEVIEEVWKERQQAAKRLRTGNGRFREGAAGRRRLG